METDRTIACETLSRMVASIRPGATIRDAGLAERGHLSVYQLVVDTATGRADWVLKASPDGDRHGIDTEARLLSLLAARTSIPVPQVLGAVDSHPTLPAPYVLMERVDGTQLPKRDNGALPDAVLERVARQSGRYLADLHSLNGPDGYSQVEIEPPASLTGERPSIDHAELTVAPIQGSSAAVDTAWPAVLRTWATETLDRHAATRFGDLTEELRPAVLEAIESLDGPFNPVLGRIDHGLHNLLLIPDTGEVTGVIDWAFTLSVPAAYDIACVVANFTLGPWAVHPASPDRRQLVEKSLLDGYEAEGQSRVLDAYRRNGAAYELIALLRAMNHLDTATAFVMPGATDEHVDATARAYRDLSTEWL